MLKFYFRSEIIVSLRSHLLLSEEKCIHIFYSRKKKYVEEKSSQSKISSCLLAYTYTCVICTHIRIYVCRDLVHLDFPGPPGVSSGLLGSHRVPHLCNVCVCARIHTHTPTYTPTRVKHREDTENTPIFPSVKDNPSRQATSALID